MPFGTIAQSSCRHGSLLSESLAVVRITGRDVMAPRALIVSISNLSVGRECRTYLGKVDAAKKGKFDARRALIVTPAATGTRHNAAVGSPGLASTGRHSLTVASRCGVPTGFTSLLGTSPDIATLGVKRTAFGQRGRAMTVLTNHFEVHWVPKQKIYHYHGALYPAQFVLLSCVQICITFTFLVGTYP